jgi:hypothetical protein
VGVLDIRHAPVEPHGLEEVADERDVQPNGAPDSSLRLSLQSERDEVHWCELRQFELRDLASLPRADASVSCSLPFFFEVSRYQSRA